MGHRPTLYPLGATRYRLMQVVRSIYGRPVCPVPRPPAARALRLSEPAAGATFEEWVNYWLNSEAQGRIE